MQEHVGVAVPVQSLVVRNVDAANPQRTSWDETVRVIAQPYFERWGNQSILRVPTATVRKPFGVGSLRPTWGDYSENARVATIRLLVQSSRPAGGVAGLTGDLGRLPTQLAAADDTDALHEERPLARLVRACL